MAQALHLLRRADQPPGAAPVDLARLAHRFGAAFGAVGGEVPGGALLIGGEVFDDLRNDVSGALHHDTVAGADAEPRDLIRIVEGGVADNDAADRHRLQLCHRRQLAGAADLDVDIVEGRLRAFGRKLVCDCPARGAGDEAQTLLPVKAIDLVHDAVDVEGQVGALAFDAVILGEGVAGSGNGGEAVGDGKAPLPNGGDHGRLGGAGEGGRLSPAMREKAQGAPRRHTGVLLPQRTGGGVARIGELACFLARLSRFLGQPLVQGGEIGLRHINLAADLEDIGRIVWEVGGNVRDGAHIGGHVLARGTVTAGQRLDQPALFVAERAGQAVDLRFCGERHLLVITEAQEAADPGDEFLHLLVAERIVEAGHRACVRHLREMARGRCTDLPRGGIGADEVREGGLQRIVAADERIIVRVGYLRRIVGVVEAVVARDLAGEILELGSSGGFGGGKRGHAGWLGEPGRAAKPVRPMRKGPEQCPGPLAVTKVRRRA